MQDLDFEHPKQLGNAVVYLVHVSTEIPFAPDNIEVNNKTWKFGNMKKIVDQ